VIVLGIDPGTASLGYGIVEREGADLRAIDHGVVTTTPDRPMPDRLLALHDALEAIVDRHRPTVVGVERLFFSTNVQTALAVGQARGVVLLVAARHGVAVREATPNEVKTAVAGYGAADKEQVGRMVALVLGMAAPPVPDDAADALAIAVWAANTERLIGGEAPGRSASSSIVDRAAVQPIAGETPYERAVREALAAERRSARR
jgi:crossover junction endodeoxyribonuclease RuvC